MDIVMVIDKHQIILYSLQERIDRWLRRERMSDHNYLRLRLGFFCFVYGAC